MWGARESSRRKHRVARWRWSPDAVASSGKKSARAGPFSALRSFFFAPCGFARLALRTFAERKEHGAATNCRGLAREKAINYKRSSLSFRLLEAISLSLSLLCACAPLARSLPAFHYSNCNPLTYWTSCWYQLAAFLASREGPAWWLEEDASPASEIQIKLIFSPCPSPPLCPVSPFSLARPRSLFRFLTPEPPHPNE